jgi:acyl carrier protein
MKQAAIPREDEVLTVIHRFLSAGYGTVGGEGDSLQEVGVDSFGLMELVVHLEEQLHCKVPYHLLTADNTKTAHALAQTVARLLKEGGGG